MLFWRVFRTLIIAASGISTQLGSTLPLSWTVAMRMWSTTIVPVSLWGSKSVQVLPVFKMPGPSGGTGITRSAFFLDGWAFLG